MEWFSAEFFTALFSIIIIDLVLAGDNAIVIGMAARNLPKEYQKQVILWGTVGAIGIRILATLAVVALLKIPGLMFAGGLLLIWIAYKLLIGDKKRNGIQAGDNRLAAIKTIIVADAIMGLDNVLAIAGSASGNFWLVVIGLLISIPLVVWGSTIIIRLIERYPVIIYIGAAVIAFTAGKMVTGDPIVKGYFDYWPLLKYAIMAIIIAGVLLAGRKKNLQQEALS